MNRSKEKCCYEDAMIYEPEMECKPHPRPHKETEVILNCGTVKGSGPVPFYVSCPQVQASVVLDTEKLKNAAIKIDFSALISFKTTDEDFFLHLGFKLSKICGGASIHLGDWTFEKGHFPNYMVGNALSAGAPQHPQPPDCDIFLETDAFCFSCCECEDCPGCCRYIVELVDQQCWNIDYAVVTNISLTAMAVGEKKYY
ncbi:MAG: DUF4489 domain-containing protein [Syntrophomonadaceae bacterium]|nr:DUF4489 domain-containing protein [Syntrophomonadaceae bacterium]